MSYEMPGAARSWPEVRAALLKATHAGYIDDFHQEIVWWIEAHLPVTAPPPPNKEA